MPVDETTMLIRIGAAALLGIIVGLERETHGRAAGLRSCMLVAMAGALVMSLALHLAQIFNLPEYALTVRVDPGRLPSYAIAGMGFLGAGAIIQGRRSARGVTTAASMWTCTVCGLSVGAGLYWPAVLVVGLTLVALALFPLFVHRMSQEQFVTLMVEAHFVEAIDRVRELLQKYRAVILFAGREFCLEAGIIKYQFAIKIRSGPQWKDLLAEVHDVPGIACYSWLESEVP
ncbi:MAG: MgtC/SapB family protein [Deltaproteobacteria bacterium]|nr:MgtC/SapB family protein [Deltaproteobacteria bacterium]